MAKPITGIPPFSGKAAKWLGHYLDSAKPDPRKVEQARKDRQVAEQIKRLPRR